MIHHWVTHLQLLSAALPSFETASVTESFWLRWPFLLLLRTFPCFMGCTAPASALLRKPCMLEQCLLNLSPHLYPLRDRFSCAWLASLFPESVCFILNKNNACPDQFAINNFDSN
jgi:hypothetical protein